MILEESTQAALRERRSEGSDLGFRASEFAPAQSGIPNPEQRKPCGEGNNLTGDVYFQPRWYAAYTRSRHEKAVSEMAERKSIETFLPLYEVVRRWKNGDHRVQFPLFPGYAFVRIALRDRQEVLKVPGVVCLVGFNGTPVALPDEEVETMRRALSHGLKAMPHPYLTVGQGVRVTAGPLVGLQGILVRRKGAFRLIVSVDLIQRSVLVDLDANVLDPIGHGEA